MSQTIDWTSLNSLGGYISPSSVYKQIANKHSNYAHLQLEKTLTPCIIMSQPGGADNAAASSRLALPLLKGNSPTFFASKFRNLTWEWVRAWLWQRESDARASEDGNGWVRTFRICPVLRCRFTFLENRTGVVSVSCVCGTPHVTEQFKHKYIPILNFKVLTCKVHTQSTIGVFENCDMYVLILCT